jgi:multiple sugar transport system ATP-binding protein
MGRIALHGITKSFAGTEAIRGVDLDVADGEFVVVVGPSGCGKSTLLRLIAGLEGVTAGRIEIDGRDVTRLEPVGRRLAMVFQSYALYPHMTVRGNMAFGLETARAPKAEIAAKVAEAARVLALEPLLDRTPRQLSGGQRQRVAIGRAIVRDPVAFLFDEPLSNLDAALRVQTRHEIAGLHRRLGRTVIYVTHDQVEAMTLADRIVVMDAGRVRQADAPEALYERPADLFVAQFIGSPRMNVLPAALAPGGVSILGGPPIPAPPLPRPPVNAGMRPEHLTLAPPGEGALGGTVSGVEYLGADSTLFVAHPAGPEVTVRVPGRPRVREGEAVGLALAPGALHLFDAAGRAIRPEEPVP